LDEADVDMITIVFLPPSIGPSLAILRSLVRVPATGGVHPTESDAVWSIVTTGSGNRLLQVSTFGSDVRLSGPKVSQTIQLDASTAAQLLSAIVETFGAPNSKGQFGALK